jgi:DNA-binding CsgD family transcriptional regulator
MRPEQVGRWDRTDVRSRAMPVGVGLFALIAVFIGMDVAGDYRAGAELDHLIGESVVMVLSLVGAGVLWTQLRTTREHASQLTIDLAAAQREAERFRGEASEALRGLSEAIDHQFARWGLTPAERDVGLLLLKGLSHKEIAAARETSETTIRQQALALYRKAGLRSRSELSAFFLEDLLLPVEQR